MSRTRATRLPFPHSCEPTDDEVFRGRSTDHELALPGVCACSRRVAQPWYARFVHLLANAPEEPTRAQALAVGVFLLVLLVAASVRWA